MSSIASNRSYHRFVDEVYFNKVYLSFFRVIHMRLRLVQNWVEVTVNTQVDILIEAVNQGINSNLLKPGNEVSRTMVFANTVEAVEAVANILSGAGIHCFRYHRDGSLEERAQNLVDFQQKGGVFVCTDAAARGLDVTNVSHVIQVRDIVNDLPASWYCE